MNALHSQLYDPRSTDQEPQLGREYIAPWPDRWRWQSLPMNLGSATWHEVNTDGGLHCAKELYRVPHRKASK